MSLTQKSTSNEIAHSILEQTVANVVQHHKHTKPPLPHYPHHSQFSSNTTMDHKNIPVINGHNVQKDLPSIPISKEKVVIKQSTTSKAPDMSSITSHALLEPFLNNNRSKNQSSKLGTQVPSGSYSSTSKHSKYLIEYNPNKYPQTMEVLVQARVRINDSLQSQHITDLPEGTIVTIAEVSGRRARITQPIHGWCSLKSKFGARILMPHGINFDKIGGSVVIPSGADINGRVIHPQKNITAKVIDYEYETKLHKILFENGSMEHISLKTFKYYPTKNTQEIGLSPTAALFDPRGGGQVQFFNQFFTRDYPYFRAQPESTTRDIKVESVQEMAKKAAELQMKHAIHTHGRHHASRMMINHNSQHMPVIYHHSPSMEGGGGGGSPVLVPMRNTKKDKGYEELQNQEFDHKVQEIERRIIQHLHQRGYTKTHPDYDRYLQKAKELAFRKASSDKRRKSKSKTETTTKGKTYFDEHGNIVIELSTAQEEQARQMGLSDKQYKMYLTRHYRKKAALQRQRYEHSTHKSKKSESSVKRVMDEGLSPINHRNRRHSGVKGLIVLRGLPGSGKTTLARKLADRSNNARICTEDKYHWSGKEDGVGEYKFQPQLVFLAREWCSKEIRECIKNNVNLVILDNHNARISMYEDHIQFAVQQGYRFRIIEFVANNSLIDKYRTRSYKKFPREVYVKLLKLWEKDPRTELINPTFAVDGDVNTNGIQNNKRGEGMKNDDEQQSPVSVLQYGGQESYNRRPLEQGLRHTHIHSIEKSV